MTKPTLLAGGEIFDGTGNAAFPGEVLIIGNRIETVAQGWGKISSHDTEVRDCRGMIVMPGLTEGHAHVTYCNVSRAPALGEIPPEENVLEGLLNAQKLLQIGYTSIFSGASAKERTDIVIRNAIESGQFWGPRMRATSREITSTGTLGDENLYHIHRESFATVADGADELQRLVRFYAREGVDAIKMNLSNDDRYIPGTAGTLTYSEAEIDAAASEAHRRGKWLVAHARGDLSVRMALKYGFRVIFHTEGIEPETLDLLDAAKDEIFVGPTFGGLFTAVHGTDGKNNDIEINEGSGNAERLRDFPEKIRRMVDRGIRVVPGGDYAFAWNPLGTNTRDLALWVDEVGLSAEKVLMAATKWGGELMGIDHLGLIAPGYLADVIVVQGSPLKNIHLLCDPDNVKLVIKDGLVYKDTITRTVPDGVQHLVRAN